MKQQARQYLEGLGYTVETGPPLDFYVVGTLGLKIGAIPTREELGTLPIGLGYSDDGVALVSYLPPQVKEPLKVSDWLRSKREALEAGSKAFSLRQVADRVGISPSYLSKIERGEKTPSEEILRHLAADLRIDNIEAQLRVGRVDTSLLLRPRAAATLIRSLSEPREALDYIRAHAIKDGNW